MMINKPKLNQQAVLKYLPNDLQVVQPGDHVVCAVTGAQIDLAELRYWNVELQEAYAGPEVALKRYLALKPPAR